jgi:hypothetical protein
MRKTCPNCQSKSGIRKIFYGLPDGPWDDSKFAPGGCCISDNDPTLRCIECGWEGEYVNNMPSQDRTIKVAKLKPIADMTDAEIDEYAKVLWKRLSQDEWGSKNDNSNS